MGKPDERDIEELENELPCERDIEEPENELDSQADSDPIDFWEKKQRELVTSVVDYNLSTLADLVTQESIDLSPRYQRRNRWDKTRQSKLIESFLMNVPVPPIFLNEDRERYGHYSIIDGKQRLTAIHEFFRGRLELQKLEVFSDANGLTIDTMPRGLQSVLKTRPTMRAVIILRQSDEDVKFEVFQRLNTGGVKLNPQEIRNSAYPGPLNELILDLSENPKFHRLLHITRKDRSALYEEMRDAEFVLRYFAFKDSWKTFKSGMKRQLDQYMADNQYADEGTLGRLKEDFLSTIDTVAECFDDHAFQRYLPETDKWKRQVLAALFDAQMFGARGLSIERVSGKQEAILDAQKQLFRDDEFRRSIDSATNTPAYFRSRIEIVKAILHRITES